MTEAAYSVSGNVGQGAVGRGQKGEIIKGHQETGGEEYVHYLECSHAVMNIYVYMTKLIKLYTLNMCSLLYIMIFY